MSRFLLGGLLVLGAAIGGHAAADDTSRAPDFALKDPAGTTWRLSDQRGKWVVLEWVNFDCPFVKKHYDPSHRNLPTLQARYRERGVVWFSINSSVTGAQGHLTPEAAVARLAAEKAVPTALLLDADGAVGKAFGAKTTPDMRIIDPEGNVAYSGALDDNRGKDAEGVASATNYVSTFLDSVLGGNGRPFSYHPPYGCSVKYSAPTDAADLAPAFTLVDATGTKRSLADYRGKWVVLEWVNFDCPFVKKHYDPNTPNMPALQAKYTERGVVWLSINSSAEGLQGHLNLDTASARIAKEKARPTAFLLDPTGDVGRAYGAKTTPDMRVIDPEGRIVYAGAIDSVRSAKVADIANATNHVVEVLDAVLAGKPAPYAAHPPYGCSVKYAAPAVAAAPAK